MWGLVCGAHNETGTGGPGFRAGAVFTFCVMLGMVTVVKVSSLLLVCLYNE